MKKIVDLKQGDTVYLFDTYFNTYTEHKVGCCVAIDALTISITTDNGMRFFSSHQERIFASPYDTDKDYHLLLYADINCILERLESQSNKINEQIAEIKEKLDHPYDNQYIKVSWHANGEYCTDYFYATRVVDNFIEDKAEIYGTHYQLKRGSLIFTRQSLVIYDDYSKKEFRIEVVRKEEIKQLFDTCIGDCNDVIDNPY